MEATEKIIGVVTFIDNIKGYKRNTSYIESNVLQTLT